MSNPPPADPSPETALYRMLDGFRNSQVLHVAAKLALADALGEGPLTAAEAAARVGAHAPSLLRLMRYLTAIGILVEDEHGRFSATPLGELLRADHPQSLRPWALLFGSPSFWRSWGELHETVVTGQPAFNRIFGEGHFDYLSRNPEDAAIFNAAMSRGTRGTLDALLAAYDFTRFHRVVDVAGGHGALLRGILEQAPNARGVLYEMPATAAEARELRGSPVEGRCEFVGGDMFASVPAGGDLYVMKHILHDWDDAAALRLLKNCRAAMRPEGVLLVVERVVLPPNQPDPAKAVDLMMLVMLTGRERTAAEFRDLYQQAGFRLSRVIPTGDFSLIEGLPI